jgi:tetratricopeptide (TPR) repeat protein
MPTDKAFELAHKYSSKALQLDSQLSLGHVARAAAYMFHDWKWNDGYNSLKKALELNPASNEAQQLLFYYHAITGNMDEAIQVLETAYSVDPLSPVVNHFLAQAYNYAERYDDALRIVNHLLEMYPSMRASLELKGWITGWQGNWHKAAEIFLEVHKQTGHPLKGLFSLAFAYGKLGEKEKALDCIRKMQQRQREEPDAIVDSELAIAWWGIGEKQKSIQYLQNCIDKKLGSVAFLLDSKLFEGLKEFPEYEIFKKKLNL